MKSTDRNVEILSGLREGIDWLHLNEQLLIKLNDVSKSIISKN